MPVIKNLGNDVAEAPAAVTAPQTPLPPVAPPKAQQAKIAVRPLHDFPLPYRNGVHVYRKDQIITDPLLVEYMLKNNCPVVRVEEKVDYQVCPKCFHHF